MMKAGRGRPALAVAVISMLMFGSTVVLASPAASAQEAIDDGELFLGDNGPPAGSERLEAVRANGGVDEWNEPFVPQQIDTSSPGATFDVAPPAGVDLTAEELAELVPNASGLPGLPGPDVVTPDPTAPATTAAPSVTTTTTTTTAPTPSTPSSTGPPTEPATTAPPTTVTPTTATPTTATVTTTTTVTSSETPTTTTVSTTAATTTSVPLPTTPATTTPATTTPATNTPPPPPASADVFVMPPIPAPETIEVDLVVPVANESEFQATVDELVVGVGGKVVDTFEGIALVDVPTPARPALTQQMASRGIELREPVSIGQPDDTMPVPDFGRINPSIVKLTRANQYHQAGFKGGGVKIGVIDYFNVSKYWNTNEHGPRPIAGVNAKCISQGRDCTSRLFSGVIGSDWDRHGEAVVEVIRDMAPNAQIYIASVSVITDTKAVMDWFRSKGVTIISRSLGSGYDHPGDGSGPEAALPTYAAKRNMILVNSAGNEGDQKYYRHKVRLGANNYILFGPSGNEPYLVGRGCMSIFGLRWANDWYLPPSKRTDYDFYLFTTDGQNNPRLLQRSERRQNQGASPFESLGQPVCPAKGQALFLVGVWRSGPRGGDTLEILDYHGGFFKYTTPYGSIGTAIDVSKERGFLTVGAIDPPESGKIATYSSRGPTNDGRIVPSLSAPSGARNSLYDSGTFNGTSAAAPCVAGALALLQQSRLAKGPRSLADLARKSVIDRGKKGPDNTYGTGQLRLPRPPSRTVPSTPSRFVPLQAPKRLLDTRPATAVGPKGLIGKMRFGEVRELPIRGRNGIPKNATAIAINLTTVEPDIPSYVQAFPTGYAEKESYSNVNTDLSKQIRANFAIVPIGVDGSISLYTAFGGDLVVDALGYFTPAGSKIRAGRFRSIGTSQRVLDTRNRNSPTRGKALRKGQVVRVPMPKGVKASKISALVVTVTGAEPTQPAVLQAYPRGTPKVRGETSTVNLDPKLDAANLAIVPTTGGGIEIIADVQNGGSVHAVVDVIGYMTSSNVQAGGSGRFVPVTPARALDSRKKGGFLNDRSVRTVHGSDAPGVKVPNSASGIVWNVTATKTKRPGIAVVWAYQTKRPGTSALNWGPGYEYTRAAAVIAGAKQGASNFALVANTPRPVPNAQLVVDVFGYFT